MSEKFKLRLLGADPNEIKEIHLVGRYALGVSWEDGHGSIYPFPFLRQHCPCDHCAGSLSDPLPEGENWPMEIKRVEGGIRIGWQSGHETRYPGARLREICACALCTEAHENR